MTESGKNSATTKDLPTTSRLTSSPMKHESFEDFWKKVLEYSEKTGLPTEYLEDEFIIDGELITVNINYKKQPK